MGVLRENREHGLRAISITAADEDEMYLDAAKARGLGHTIASANWFGQDSPYLNLNETAGPTYAFVIGRSGGVVWAGNHAKDQDAFLEALREALAAPAAPALPPSLDGGLDDAVRAYVERDFPRAEKIARKIAARHRKKKDPASQELAAQAERLATLVTRHHDALAAPFVDSADDSATAEDIARSYLGLLADFPKAEATRRAEKWIAGRDAGRDEVRAHIAWLELAAQRPPLFTSRFEKPEKRYARKLESYLKKNPAGPGAPTASAWLEARARARE